VHYSEQEQDGCGKPWVYQQRIWPRMKKTGRLTVGRVISEEVQLRIMSTGEGSGADDWQEGTEER